jgi:RNA polymerase sigma-70 factor (ECF subfamily)
MGDPSVLPGDVTTHRSRNVLIFPRSAKIGEAHGPLDAPPGTGQAPMPPPHGPLEDYPDHDLLVLASAGAVPAFVELVRRYEGRLRRYCAKWCGDVARGDELAQDVLLDIWRARSRYRPEAPFVAYLFTVARNRCRSEGRRRPRDEASRAPATLEGVQPEQLDALLVRERQRRTDDAIAELAPKLREALLLRYGADLDYHQISELLGVRETTARSRVFEAVAKLRTTLGERT